MPRKKEKEPPRKRKPAYYWWMLANILAACFAVLSWVLCLNIFQHPENPRNYEILRKLGQAGVPLPLTEMQAPPGQSADPRALYNLYAGKPKKALDRNNAALMRNYLSQLKDKELIRYVEGDYKVEAVRQLTPKDLFPVGFVVRARAMIAPDEFTDPLPFPVVIEYLFPTQNKEGKILAIQEVQLEEMKKADERKAEADPKVKKPFKSKLTIEDVPVPPVSDAEIDAYAKQAMSWIAPGDILSVAKFPNCAMIVHVELLSGEDTPVVCLTVTPSAFGEYSAGPDRSFLLSAPSELHPGTPFPVFRAPAPAP